jgi:hypothetical protein
MDGSTSAGGRICKTPKAARDNGPSGVWLPANAASGGRRLQVSYVRSAIMKKIAFTFAGRKDRMHSQLAYMARALDEGVVDEWHLWNFARNAEDDAWLRQTFNESASLITDGHSVTYQPFAGNVRALALSVRARSDAHLLMRLDSGELVEVVLGAFENTRSLLRIVEGSGFAPHAPVQSVAAKALDPAGENSVMVALEESMLKIRLGGQPLFHLGTPATLITLVAVRTGYGALGEWRRARPPTRVQLKNTALQHYKGFRLAYNYYSSARFVDSVFIKLDDDIVFCDMEGFKSFVEELSNSTDLVILSANVINNGVCAYLQERSGFFANENFGFEYPPAGVCGKLWESSSLCERLHEYFLSNKERILKIATSLDKRVEIPLVDRFSINFVGFRYPIMLMMTLALQYGNEDDEHVMTRSITWHFGVKKFIFCRFVVSHLSFFKQDETLNAKGILMRYAALASETYGINDRPTRRV